MGKKRAADGQPKDAANNSGGGGNGGVKVAYEGGDGAFSQLAAQEFFARSPGAVEVVGKPDFHSALAAVASGECTHAVLPVENSAGGTFHGVYDELVLHADACTIVGELTMAESHCLCGLKDANKEGLRTVYGHPAVLNLCASYLRSLSLHVQRAAHADVHHASYRDSAEACKMLIDKGDASLAVIASAQAAQRHGLVVLETGVSDDVNNETRYFVVGRKPAQPPSPNAALKMSVAVELDNEPMALFRALSVFSFRNMNLSKVEVRPLKRSAAAAGTKARHWEYRIYLDVELARTGKAGADSALASLRDLTRSVTELGLYERNVSDTEYQQRDLPPLGALY